MHAPDTTAPLSSTVAPEEHGVMHGVDGSAEHAVAPPGSTSAAMRGARDQSGSSVAVGRRGGDSPEEAAQRCDTRERLSMDSEMIDRRIPVRDPIPHAHDAAHRVREGAVDGTVCR